METPDETGAPQSPEPVQRAGDFPAAAPPPTSAKPGPESLAEPDQAGTEPPLLADLRSTLPPPLPAPGAEVPPPAASGNYIVRHWQGKLPLGQSIWINLICLWFPWALVISLVSMGVAQLGTVSIAICYLVVLGLAHLLFAWQVVGVARSTERHRKRGGSPATRAIVWGGLVLLCSGGAFYDATHALPAAEEMIAIVRGDSQMPPMQLSLVAPGDQLLLRGGIPAGSAAKFREFLDQAPAVHILQIDSVGGRFWDAEQIARAVAQRGMTTYVANRCASAATLVFLAGKERYVGPHGRLGFHGVGFPGRSQGDLDISNAKFAKLMVAAGVNEEFAEKSMRTPNTAIWIPTTDELLAAGVITAKTPAEFLALPVPRDDEATSDFDVVLLPTDDFPAEYAADLAKQIARDTGLHLRAMPPLGMRDWHPLANGSQYDPAALKDIALPAIERMRKNYGGKVYVILTTRDIKNPDDDLRFVFAEHFPVPKISVISAARMTYWGKNMTAPSEIILARVHKMLLRTVGIQYYAMPRSADIHDIMFSPLLSLDDLDALTPNLNNVPAPSRPSKQESSPHPANP